MNPIQKAAYDIKYILFNKHNYDPHIQMREFEDYEDKAGSKNFHIKLLREVAAIFHLFNDLRQHYLMSNNVEYFYKEIYLNHHDSEDKFLLDSDYDEINNKLVREFKNIIPDAANFNNHMEYELPSIDKMYEHNELHMFQDTLATDIHHSAEMHEEFSTLMIDTFNMHSNDPFLRQLIILLICRYHSERAEFIRNLDRTILFFDNSDWRFYCWTNQQLEKFVFHSEKSNIWLLRIKNMVADIGSSLEALNDSTVNEELVYLKSILSDFKRALIYS